MVALDIRDWGIISYGAALEKQKNLAHRRVLDEIHDCLILTEHFPIVTIGRSGSEEDLHFSQTQLEKSGIDLAYVDRGGKATFHGPGQLILYPIIHLMQKDLHSYLEKLLAAAMETLQSFGLGTELKAGSPGLYINNAKIASVGIAVTKWVTYHGLSLNVNVDPSAFSCIVPCGDPDLDMTSMSRILGKSVDMSKVKTAFIRKFMHVFNYSMDGYYKRRIAV